MSGGLLPSSPRPRSWNKTPPRLPRRSTYANRRITGSATTKAPVSRRSSVTPTPWAVQEILPRRPGLAVVHFRAAGSAACDSVAAILAEVVRACGGRLPLTEIDIHDKPELDADNPPGQGR